MSVAPAAFFTEHEHKRVYCLPENPCTPPDPSVVEGEGQCVAVANRWACENGWPAPTGYSAATLTFPSPWFTVPYNQAVAGDVVIYSAYLPGSGGNGHIELFVAHITGGHRGFGQNWSGSTCEFSDHTGSELGYIQHVWRHTAPAPAPAPTPTPTEVPEMVICSVANGGGLWLLYGRTYDYLNGAEAALYRAAGVPVRPITVQEHQTALAFPGKRP